MIFPIFLCLVCFLSFQSVFSHYFLFAFPSVPSAARGQQLDGQPDGGFAVLHARHEDGTSTLAQAGEQQKRTGAHIKDAPALGSPIDGPADDPVDADTPGHLNNKSKYESD